MKCPKCHAAMEEVTLETVTIDRCTACKGLWFDANELEALEKIKGSEKLDSGEVRVGRKMDQVAEARCPRCDKVMKSMADVDQHHITFDTCESCHGIFLDAGEFADLKSYTFMDYLRGLFKHRTKKK